jgi:hypothetical protein
MLRYLGAVLIILLLLLAWVAVQALARQYATRHPEFGPAKEEGAGCGSHCGCGAGQCQHPHTPGK